MSGSERTIHPLSPETPQRHPEINITTQSRKRKSRRNLRRFIAATRITCQTMGRANPTAELILHPPCLIHSDCHGNLHPIRMLKIRNTHSITYDRTKKPPPGCVRTQTNHISKVGKPKDLQFLNYTGLNSKSLPGNQHPRLPVERPSAE